MLNCSLVSSFEILILCLIRYIVKFLEGIFEIFIILCALIVRSFRHIGGYFNVFFYGYVRNFNSSLHAGFGSILIFFSFEILILRLIHYIVKFWNEWKVFSNFVLRISSKS